MKKGKLIVIDGNDGSGKKTQVELLVSRLKSDGYSVQVVDFPEYYSNFFGGFIAHCLREQYFNFMTVHPKIASVLYAADRNESKEKIQKWIKDGHIVVANRYMSANQIHQGGKIKNAKNRYEFLKWLEKMEYEVFKIPRPSVVFYLSLPLEMTNELINKRKAEGEKRAYLRRKKDVAEYDQNYLENSHKSALWLSRNQDNWIRINCVKSKNLRSRESIHEELYSKVRKLL